MTEDSPIEYGFWTPEEGGYSVKYSLPLFQEIEFAAGEGYRRIPHGGVEVGGLLFGKIEANEILITAFRNIECEHASGPSFVLSGRDLEALSQQIEAAAEDPELQGTTVLGWFIAHTRSGLQINERELGWFERFFPRPGQVTVLVKPERFQPTKFAFLARSTDGKLSTDGSGLAILLPTSGKMAPRRAGDSALRSMPVNLGVSQNPVPPRLINEQPHTVAREIRKQTVAPPVKQERPVEIPQAVVEPEPPAVAASIVDAPQPEPTPTNVAPAVWVAPAERVAPPPPRTQVFGSESRPAERAAPDTSNEAGSVLPAFAETEDAKLAQAAFEAVVQKERDKSVQQPVQPLPSFSAPPPPQTGAGTQPTRLLEPERAREASRPQTSVLHTRTTSSYPPSRQQVTRPLDRRPAPSRGRLTAVLLCAALLGCLVGYYAYTQLPAVVIPLSVETRPKGLMISWPAEQTRDTTYAAIRVDDGSPVPLSSEEKSTGATQIAISRSNTKIEVIAQHWLRDSRGIVRYVSAMGSRSDGSPGGSSTSQPNSAANSRNE